MLKTTPPKPNAQQKPINGSQPGRFFDPYNTESLLYAPRLLPMTPPKLLPEEEKELTSFHLN